ncbi:MAG: stage III sporulation protein AB [Oscillospiraceae bacterium]|nr:stage III sporulation protein AB [Oscillospiraceae bacterium]
MPQRFEQAVRALPQRLRAAALALPETVRARAEEIRLRAGQELTVCAPQPHTAAVAVTADELAKTLEGVSHGSLHTVLDALRHGFVTLAGGHRLGVCGSAAVRDGAVAHIRDVSSLCIRVAREKKGVADKLLPSLLDAGKLPNTLIISPPGAGKTTLLRDLVRSVSDGGTRVAAADERGEIAACFGGVPQLDVGRNTDVMSYVPKAEAAMMMLRGMAPQVLALDEITAPEDAAVLAACTGCGVSVLSTAHAANADDLRRRPVYRGLLESFDRLVVISGTGPSRKYDILEVREPCLPQSALFVSS